MKKFKIRCSSLGDFLSGTIGLTDAQKTTLKNYSEKRLIKPLTEREEGIYQDLLYKEANPELPKGVKTLLDKWIKDEILYEKKIQSHNKYTVKGILNEEENIHYAARHLDWGNVTKNEIEESNEYMTGTPDVVLNDMIVDVKSSYEHGTFPILEDECPSTDYINQVKGYLELFKKQKGLVCYVLSTSPRHLIEREINTMAFNFGYDKDDFEFIMSMTDLYSYESYPSGLRIKTFEVERDDELMKEIKYRVDLSRIYIENKMKKFIY